MVNGFCRHLRYRGLSTNTIRRRRDTLRLLSAYVEPLDLADLDTAMIEAFLATRASARTRHAYRSDLRVFYRWAHERGLVASNPAETVASVKLPRSLPRPLDVGAIAACLYSGSLRTRRMVALGALAGLRVAEIAALQCEDVWLHVEPAMLVVRGGKGGRDRSIPLHPMLRELLAGLPGSGPVFAGQVGATVRPGSVSSTIRAHLARHGIIATAHQLRHTFGTELARVSGGDMVLTAALMGHASMTTTLGYVRLAHSAGTEIVGRMYGDVA